MTKPTSEQLLEFERDHLPHTGRKEEQIRLTLGITPGRYYQLLGRLIQTEEALKIDAILTHTLRRRAQTALSEQSRRLGASIRGNG